MYNDKRTHYVITCINKVLSRIECAQISIEFQYLHIIEKNNENLYALHFFSITTSM